MAGSTAVLAAILLVDLAAFGLAIGAAQSRPSASVETDARQEWTYCVYHPDAATTLGGSALALLLVGQAVAAVASRCFCGGPALRPGGARACALVLYLSSCLYSSLCSFLTGYAEWVRMDYGDEVIDVKYPHFCTCEVVPPSWVAFIIGEACLLAGLVQSAYHTGLRTVFFENPPDCETMRRGTFGAGAAFALFTCVLTSAYYYCYSKARISFHRREATIGMTPL
ncbi:hypothetical protein U9M48_009603 [Paspalum notatum var. saurae]|uniref:Fiber protein Fb34 n=1 Tax=Paspalum notatum var. saurae TaxID=547442 RepID=A0AAQ3SSX4_PASNO